MINPKLYIFDKFDDGTPWLRQRTIFLTKHGSHAYGTNIEGSDEDFKGVAIPPQEYFLGYSKKFEQAVGKDPDVTIYDIRKFFALAADCNPSIIEVLFTDPSDHIINVAYELLENRNLFLSKKAKFTFSGYAMSQLKRIETHRRWLLNPPTSEPFRTEFGLLEVRAVNKEQLGAAEAAIRKELDLTSGLPAFDLQAVAARKLGYEENFIEYLRREQNYRRARQEWDQYNTWKSERNQARAELERKHGYDCYLDDTEFLTELGWRKFDDIPEGTQVASLDDDNQLVFVLPTERYTAPYSGPIWFYNQQGSQCAVTPHHKMLVSPQRRSRKNGFSTKYSHAAADWQLIPGEILMEGRRSYYHTRIACPGRESSTLVVDSEVLVWTAAYIAEGCVGKRHVDGSVANIRVSQKVGGTLESILDEIGFAKKYVYSRKEAWRQKPCREATYIVSGSLAKSIVAACGEGSANKRLPPWALRLSNAQAERFIDILIGGDGTRRKFSDVYYTTSKQLADDLQALALANGYHTQIWGPYQYASDTTPMYQVYLRKRQILTLNMPTHVTEEIVKDRHVVCFTVPNSILITRRNGKPAIHGNTKHAMHLVRLMRMGQEILETGKVIVKRPDADELLAIRFGAWKYDDLMQWAKNMDAKLDELYKTSNVLPHTADRAKLDNLCTDFVLDWIDVCHY